MTYTLIAEIETPFAERIIRRTYRGLREEQVSDARGVVRMLTPTGSTNTFTVLPEPAK
jgi:hypothetical protein